MWTNRVKLISDLKIFKIIFKKWVNKFLKIWYYIGAIKKGGQKMFKKYEKFKQSLKSKKLSPKEYQKLVKEWMDQNEGRKKKKREK